MIAHRSFDPPCDPLARKTLPRPPHPVPNVRDNRDTPLLWDGMAESINLFLPNGEAEYFCKGGWTPGSTNCPTGKSAEASRCGGQSLESRFSSSDCPIYFPAAIRATSCEAVIGELSDACRREASAFLVIAPLRLAQRPRQCLSTLTKSYADVRMGSVQ